MGLPDDDGNSYVQLGSMKGAGTAKNVFLDPNPKNLKTRMAIQGQLLSVRASPLNSLFPTMALKAHEVIANREGFDTGVSTRLLALAIDRMMAAAVTSNSMASSAGDATGFLSPYSAGQPKDRDWMTLFGKPILDMALTGATPRMHNPYANAAVLRQQRAGAH